MLHAQATTQAEVEVLIKNILNIHPCLREEELVLKVMANTRSDWSREKIIIEISQLSLTKEIGRVAYTFIRGELKETRYLYFIKILNFEFN